MFENLRAGDAGPQQGPSFESPPAETAATSSYTLRSNNRFGDEYRSVLVDGNGNAVEIHWVPGQATGLPGQTGYTVVNVNAQELTLQQPVPCIAMEASGVRCLDANTAVLSLTTLAPLARSPSPQPFGRGREPDPDFNGPEADIVLGPDGEQVFVNPFTGVMETAAASPEEEQARAERARARNERLQQFQVERIPDDQVPPGMRLVRTPFGDRLVPIRE